jgi:potassium-transporting ATPase KdpC subunit
MKQIARSLGALVLFVALLGFGYTLLTTAIAQLLWPEQAQGSLVEVDGEIVGSRLLAQPFEDPAYFWPRPSASGYNADPELDPTVRSLSYPSNLGPSNPDLIAAIEEGVALYGEGVPVDLVTGSGSALDPHISLAGAHWQAARVAEDRNLEVDEVLRLIDDHVQSWLGRRYVNVLELNLALDQLTGRP